MNQELLKEKKKAIKRAFRRLFVRENIIKFVVLFSTLALIASSVLPYML